MEGRLLRLCSTLPTPNATQTPTLKNVLFPIGKQIKDSFALAFTSVATRMLTVPRPGSRSMRDLKGWIRVLCVGLSGHSEKKDSQYFYRPGNLLWVILSLAWQRNSTFKWLIIRVEFHRCHTYNKLSKSVWHKPCHPKTSLFTQNIDFCHQRKILLNLSGYFTI